MRKWKDYKETINLSEDIFALARSGNINRLRRFIEITRGLDINEKNHKGYSPLMIAVYRGNLDAAKLLLGKGADPNSTDFSGNTVLMGAAFQGDVEMVMLLLQRGARKNSKNHTGFTAEQWANAFGRINVVDILTTTESKPSKIQNMINAVKIIWGFLKPNTKKEAIA